jgi:hypothetical protein
MGKYSLGWYHINDDSTYKNIDGHFNLKIGRELSFLEKILIDKSIIDVTQFVTFHSYYLMEIDNINEITTLINKVIDKSHRLEPPYFDIDNNHQIQRLLSIAVLEFVLYINFIDSTLKGELKEKLKTITSRYYDEYFEYRFLYKLRNYITHCSLPNITLQDEIGWKFRKISLDTTSMLENYNSWSGVKKDLESSLYWFILDVVLSSILQSIYANIRTLK